MYFFVNQKNFKLNLNYFSEVHISSDFFITKNIYEWQIMIDIVAKNAF